MYLPCNGPKLVNCPIDDSKTKNVKPRKSKLKKYGMKNEPIHLRME